MKKAFDQTVRDLKRGVNKKVLKVPGIEQKVLDATSNEPWGPHGSNLADIAQATRNYHEYQMIMAVIWKRINDTGKNWRHVYKALTVLEYLVAHGSERVIDEIREHAYQISTLSDFQYIDSSGRDQGSNVRKKSQSLVLLVNDKERIQEVRQKAIANKDKFRNASSTGGMYRPSSYSSTGGYGDRYDDDRYGSRDEDRNGYGRERDGYKDDDRYGRYGDSYGRDGDRYSRDSEERYGRDGYRDDDYRGRSRSIDDYQYGSRSRSSDDRDRAYDDDGNYSSRGSGARADEHSQDGRRLDRKYSEQNLGAAPPSYEEAVSDARSPVHNDRDGETSAASVPKTSSPPANTSPSQAITGLDTAASPTNQEVDAFDEFDPRGSVSAAPTTSNNAEMDLLGSLSESFSSNALAIVPSTASEADAPANSGSGPTFAAASSVVNEPFGDPFGDSPFKAIPSTDGVPAQPQNFASTPSFQPTMNQSSEPTQAVAPKADAISNFDFGDTFSGITYPSNVSDVQQFSTNPQFLPQELSTPNQNSDILAGILPPSGLSPPVTSQAPFPDPTGQPAQPNANVFGSYLPQSGSTALVASHMAPQAPTGQPAQHNTGNFLPQSGFTAPAASYMAPQVPAGPTAQHNGGSFPPQFGSTAPVASHMAPQASIGPTAQHNSGNYLSQSGFVAPVASQTALQTPTGPGGQYNSDVLGNLLPQVGSTTSMTSQPAIPASTGSLAIVPQQPKDKFDPKSTVWADTLSRGLVNLNISGPKINPLADIGIDFEAINRKEKRMEKPAAVPVTSNITMGKAMGSGSGIGRAGASAIRPLPNPMMGPGVGMGNYGGMNQPMGMNMGMGMNMNMGMGMGMGMNMGMGQGVPMQPPIGLPPGSTMPAGYNPMMGTGGYAPQQPYGGGYR